MMTKKKPLPASARDAIRKVAAVLVCAEIESGVIASVYEKSTGKPYDRNGPDSYFNVFLKSDPECQRIWSLLQKDIVATRKSFSEKLRSKRGQ